MTLTRAARWLLAATIAWGAFAFGAVYPWAYWPLAVAAQIVALLGLAIPSRGAWSRLGLAPLAIALAAFVAAGLAQLVPLPAATLAAISPEASSVISRLDPSAAFGFRAHAATIAPSSTAAALGVIASLALLVLGAARLFSIVGTYATARAITVVGVALALAGIIQKPLFSGKIYGFWASLDGGNPYGPFVNKNHFAGWMLMALPIALGLLFGGIARGMRGVRPGVREKVLWLSSADASGIVLLLAAASVMALSLILTMSRSGISAAALTIAVAATLAMRRYRSSTQRGAAVVLVAAMSVLVVAWTGTDVLATRFSSTDVSDLNGRVGPWTDALRIARAYPIAGTGLNTYGVATLFYQRSVPDVHFAQAHNDYLQLAAEGGILLTVPAAAAIGFMLAAIRRRFKSETSVTTYWIRAGACIGMLAIALQELVEFSLQMPGNALLFAVLCAIALHRTPERGARAASLG